MNLVESIIEQCPYAVIVFSNFTHDPETKHVKTQGWYPAEEGCWLLCTYIPKVIADGFLDW